MIKFDILVHPSLSEPIKTPEPKPPSSKWKFPWRINMLATPKPPVRPKYQGSVPEIFKEPVPIEAATAFHCDQISRPLIRYLANTLNAHKDTGPKFVTTMNKSIEKSWNSIYNYYKKKLKEKRLKRLRRQMKKKEAKKPKGKSLEQLEALRIERAIKLATPKKLHLPEPIPRKWKALDDLLVSIDVLSAPREYNIVPPRTLGVVSTKALTYEITEAVQKLSELPERYKKRKSDAIVPGAVKRGALRAKCTERIEKLAQPSVSAREAKKLDEDKYDPWIINPNALKYKPSARILELAKPLERE